MAAVRGGAIARHPYRFLGSYRLGLATLVLLSHANEYLPAFVGPLALGNVGVFAFFVLSGFVIAEALDVFYPGAPQRFLANRFLKIFPPYWAACGLAAAVYALGAHPDFRTDAASVLGNLSIVFAPPQTFLWISVIWAVGIELRFYVLAALLDVAARALARRGIPASLVLGVAAVGALGLYLITVHSGFMRLATFRHAPFFVFGMASYFWLRNGSRGAAAAALGSGPLALHSYWVYNAAGPTALAPSLLLFAACVTLMLFLARIEGSPIIERMDKRLGDLTYALYLAHWPIVFAVGKLALPDALALTLILVASFATAAAIVALVERPTMRVRDRIRRQRLYA